MGQKPLPDDFKELIRCLNSSNVRYLLVGGWAVGLHGNPRATGDIDFLVAIDDGNLAKLQEALLVFGAPPVDLERFKEKGRVIRMGSSPVQVDIINSATGIDIDECYHRKVIINFDGVNISVVSRDDLIKNKMATGRTMDLADAEKLEKHARPQK
jgi:hypothetical protein